MRTRSWLVLLAAFSVVAGCEGESPQPIPRGTPVPQDAVITDRRFVKMSVPSWTVVGTTKAGDFWRVTVEAEVHNESDSPATPVCYVRFHWPLDLLYPAEESVDLQPGDWVNIRSSAYLDVAPRGDSGGVFCRPLEESESIP